jgi:phage shock protein PspC (stress-responsive transcriptional regulator)
MQVNPRRLYRSRRDRQLAGVAGGMAEYLEVDPTVVRILWILSVFLGGFTILLYIIMAFVVPLDPRGLPAPGGGAGPGGEGSPEGAASNPDWAAAPQWAAPDQRSDARGGRGGLIIGVMLVVFGSIALANILLPGWAVGVALGPAFLVALGIALVVGAARRSTSEP